MCCVLQRRHVKAHQIRHRASTSGAIFLKPGPRHARPFHYSFRHGIDHAFNAHSAPPFATHHPTRIVTSPC